MFRDLSARLLAIMFMLGFSAAHAADDPVARGKEVYMMYGCAVCHGKDGEGDGISSRGMYPPPTNFHKPASFTHGHDKDSIRHSIQFGVKEENSIMPPFGHIPQRELEDLSAYVVSLQEMPHDGVTVKGAWVQAMPPSAPATAAYLTLVNNTDNEAVLVSASTDAARVTEVHQMSRKDGMMRMGMAKAIAIPAHSTLELAQGGYHIMLIDVKKDVKKGDTVPLTLHFKDGQTVSVKAVIRDE